jgi:hypothetical protein
MMILKWQEGRALAVGPSIKYESAKGWFVTAKWRKETHVRNRTGGDALLVKLVLPLGNAGTSKAVR